MAAMKKLIKFLGSLEFTAILMLALAIWFTLGAILSVSSQYGNTMRRLNDQLVLDSLFGIVVPSAPVWSPMFSLANIEQGKMSGFPMAVGTVIHWLWGAVAISFLIGINLILATKDWLMEFLRRKFNYRKVMLLLMHLLFGIVLLGHLVSAVSGFKLNGFPLKPGLHAELSDGYRLNIDRVSPESEERNGQSGKHEPEWYSTDGFTFSKSKVFFTLFKDGAPVFKGVTSDFEPACFDGFQFTVTPFSFRSQVSHDFIAQGVGEKLTVSKNPGTAIMVIFQPIWIIIVSLYVATVLIPANKRSNLNKRQGVW
jgi:hypothetical protein